MQLIELSGLDRLRRRQGYAEAESAAVLKTVRPAEGEDAYARVPWLTSLWEARQKAAKEGKPILLWEMDGHPLGCG